MSLWQLYKVDIEIYTQKRVGDYIIIIYTIFVYDNNMCKWSGVTLNVRIQCNHNVYIDYKIHLQRIIHKKNHWTQYNNIIRYYNNVDRINNNVTLN